MTRTRDQLAARIAAAAHSLPATRAGLEVELAAIERAEGRLEAALAAARRARALAPDLEAADIAEAQALLALQRADEALHLASDAHARRGSRAWSWVVMARALALHGDHEQALKAALAGLRDHRGAVPLWEELAYAWTRLGDDPQAAQAVEALRGLGAHAQAARLEIAIALQRGDAAVGDEAKAALAADSRVGELLLEGAACLARRDAEGARAAADRLVAQGSVREGWSLRASAHALRSEFGDAADAMRRAIDRTEGGAQHWEALVTYRLAATQTSRAHADAVEAVRAHPGAARLWQLLSATLEQGDRPRGALAAVEIALALRDDPHVAAARDQLRQQVGHAELARTPPTAETVRRVTDEIAALDDVAS